MGTWYHISWSGEAGGPDTSVVQAGVERILEHVNASMSTYLPDSEISRFNDLNPGEWFTPTAGLLQVFEQARQVSLASDGAYDVTVAPLVDLWGFGPERHSTPPGIDEINATLAWVGEQYIELDDGGRMRKLRPLQLDLSSIAKGYGVDRVSLWLSEQRIDNHMVEIGGEIRVRGLSPRGSPWRIAVEQPDPLQREVAAVLELVDVAVATSGDYRNFFELDGERYSHTIDPHTGRPVRHELVSVTVLQPSAAMADAWATALATLGRQRSLQLAEALGLPVYLISREGDGFRVDKSTAIETYLR